MISKQTSRFVIQHQGSTATGERYWYDLGDAYITHQAAEKTLEEVVCRNVGRGQRWCYRVICRVTTVAESQIGDVVERGE